MGDVNNTLLMQKLVALLDKQNKDAEATISHSGIPPDGGNLESRIAKLESHVEHIQRDVTEIKGDVRSIIRWGLAIFGGGFVLTWTGLIGLAFILAKGFHWF